MRARSTAVACICSDVAWCPTPQAHSWTASAWRVRVRRAWCPATPPSGWGAAPRCSAWPTALSAPATMVTAPATRTARARPLRARRARAQGLQLPKAGRRVQLGRTRPRSSAALRRRGVRRSRRLSTSGGPVSHRTLIATLRPPGGVRRSMGVPLLPGAAGPGMQRTRRSRARVTTTGLTSTMAVGSAMGGTARRSGGTGIAAAAASPARARQPPPRPGPGLAGPAGVLRPAAWRRACGGGCATAAQGKPPGTLRARGARPPWTAMREVMRSGRALTSAGATRMRGSGRSGRGTAAARLMAREGPNGGMILKGL